MKLESLQKRRVLPALLLLGLLATPLSARAWQEGPHLANLFEQAGLRGTFVLYDAQSGQLIGHDRRRARTRFIPASTFKLPNTLIGLNAGAVRDVDEVFPYDGQARFFKAWEAPMGLREAIRVSNVPVYQELARRIGRERMRSDLKLLGYGNCSVGSQIDEFWLEGPLKISAIEQCRFLEGLARGVLPFAAQHQAAVREITLLESGPGWELHAKTGTVREPGLAWWVGWVVKDGRLYCFALNIDCESSSIDTAARIQLGKACLKALGVL